MLDMSEAGSDNNQRFQKEREDAIKWYRSMLIACITATEHLDPNLHGWGEAILDDINSYDSVFEELHEKYKDLPPMPISPEAKLTAMLAGSGVTLYMSAEIARHKNMTIYERIYDTANRYLRFVNFTTVCTALNTVSAIYIATRL